MIIEIKAFDTLFFRDGKPFSMGENHWTDSIFPPNISTIYGGLRSAYFHENPGAFKDLKRRKLLNTREDPTKKLVIKRVFYRIIAGANSGYYYPMPLDLVKPKELSKKEKEEKAYKAIALKSKKNNYLTSSSLDCLLYAQEQIETIGNGLIYNLQLGEYIRNKKKEFEIYLMSDYIIDEPKVGIGLNNKTGTSDDKKLYRIDLKRPKNLVIMVEFEGIKLKSEGIMRLGGEGKYVSYEEVEENFALRLPKAPEMDKYFKFTLITPALFLKNSFPIDEDLSPGGDKPSYIIENKRFKIKLKAAAIGKHLSIGGFDIAKRRPKPMLKAVPPGTTYFFEILEGDTKDIIDFYNWKTISHIKAEEGYGIGFISKWEGY
ncbi:MAG: type III-B CRISPR module-associated protein Cmr3 [Clostridium sp.]|nr:type III-B CRISPR module-associated protein Cmr3 [Clostridium sp.]